MNILVFSDSHGHGDRIEDVISRQIAPPDAIFFLGDGLRDLAWINTRGTPLYSVRGNCDFYSTFKGISALKTDSITLAGFKITFTHGDLYDVKYTAEKLSALAERTGSDIVLFGHTHIPYEKYFSDGEKPYYLFNPGSIGTGSHSYGVMMLDKAPLLSHGEF